MPKSTICLKAPKKQGEKTISLVNKLGLFNKSLKIQREKDSLCIPLVRQPSDNELAILNKQVSDYRLDSSKIFTEKQHPARSLIQVLENKLSPHLLSSLPQALDIIGNIAIIEIPLELKAYENQIGQAIMETHKNIKTVLAKAGAISGTYRVRNLTLIAGDNKTQTIHKEFGCSYHVDLARAFFSPRLSHEHERVALLVKSGETVVDLFAGVGPFSILIAKKNPKVKVYAVDINPEAVELLRVNVRVNRVENRVFPILGDAKEIAAAKLSRLGDRVIMNLPETAMDFVNVACQVIKPQGGIIHFYAFIRAPNSIENSKLMFLQEVKQAGKKLETFLYGKSIRETAPYESQIVLDAKVD